MKEIDELKSEIEKIKERNKRVEMDKVWETSWIRKIFIAASTYILVVILLISIGADKPFATAIVPAVAYIISTAGFGILKEWWLEKS